MKRTGNQTSADVKSGRATHLLGAGAYLSGVPRQVTQPGFGSRMIAKLQAMLLILLAISGLATTAQAVETQFITSNLLTVANGGFSNRDDAVSPFLPIGFTFRFGGVDYTQCRMSTNGILYFTGNGGSEWTNTDLSGRTSQIGVYALWDDLYVGNYSGTDETTSRALYYTTGAVGSRIFIMQWTTWYSFAEPYEVGTFNVVLHEGTNAVDIYYRNMLGNSAQRRYGASATIGIRADAAFYSQYSFNQPVATQGKLLTYTPSEGGVAPYALTEQVVTEATTAAIPTFFLTHTNSPQVPVNLSASPSTPNQTSASLSWDVSALGAIPTGFRIRYATNPALTGLIETSTFTSPGHTYVLNGLNPGTTYYFQVVSFEGSTTSNSTISDFTQVPNNAPVAVDASFAVLAGTPYNGVLVATDVDNNPTNSGLIYSVTTAAQHGMASITDSATGAYTYTPTTGYNGPDSFVFKAFDGTAYSNEATVTISVGAPPMPEIKIEQTVGTDLPSGGSVAFGTLLVGNTSDVLLTIHNTGGTNLTGLTTVLAGSDFLVTVPATAPVTAGGSTTLTVRFAPTTGGNKTATLHILSNDADESDFSIMLSGRGNTAPMLSVPNSPITVEGNTLGGAVVDFIAEASDLEDGSLTANVSPISGSTFPVGNTTVNVSATDSDGVLSSTSFVVTVQDTTAPVVAAHGNVTAEATSAAGAVVNFAAGSATDAVTASPTITYSQASGTSFPVGVTTVTISAEDAAHNVATGTFTVTVGDMTGPVITLNGDATLFAALDSTFTDPGATALDAVDGSVSVNVAGSVDTSVAGDYTLTYTAEDATHHAATPVVRTVTVYLAAVAVDDVVTATAGETRVYPLANDYDSLRAELSLVSTDGPGVVIEDRALVIPAGYVGTFRYVATNGRGPSSASVTVLAGTPATARSLWAGLLYDSTGAIAGRMQTLRNSAGRFTYAVRVGANQIGGIFALNAMGTATVGGLTITEDADHRLAITYTSGGTLTGNLRQSAASVTPRQLNVALAGADRTALPGGGYLRAYVRTASKVNILGVLPDGRSFVTVSPLADNGSISFYITATRTPGAFIGGELTLGDLPATDCTGEVEWTHASVISTLVANGSFYSAGAALPSGSCTLTLAGGNLASPITTATSAASGKPALSTAIPAWLAKPATGIFVARVKTPASFRAVKGSGIYLQKSHSAWGTFLGTPVGGSISLTQP